MIDSTWSRNATPRTRYWTGRGAACRLTPDLRKCTSTSCRALIIHRNHDTATNLRVSCRHLPSSVPSRMVRGVRRVLRMRTEIDPDSRNRSDGCKSRKTTTFKPNWLGGRGSFPAAPGAVLRATGSMNMLRFKLFAPDILRSECGRYQVVRWDVGHGDFVFDADAIEAGGVTRLGLEASSADAKRTCERHAGQSGEQL